MLSLLLRKAMKKCFGEGAKPEECSVVQQVGSITGLARCVTENVFDRQQPSFCLLYYSSYLGGPPYYKMRN